MIESIEITFQCNECDKKSTGDEYNGFHVCDDCMNKIEEERIDGKDLLEHLYDNGEHVLDGEHIFGFDSESDKIIFMKGVKYGFDHAGFKIVDYLGHDEFGEILDKLSENFRKLKVNPNYNAETEEKVKNGTF